MSENDVVAQLQNGDPINIEKIVKEYFKTAYKVDVSAFLTGSNAKYATVFRSKKDQKVYVQQLLLR